MRFKIIILFKKHTYYRHFFFLRTYEELLFAEVCTRTPEKANIICYLSSEVCLKNDRLAILYNEIITINVPMFKKLRDIIFFGGENHFMSHF
jgi:hypothetical protein